jgi:biopolymer transport protein ExbB/TolQ
MTISDYFAQSGAIAYLVIGTLSFYFIATIYIFIYRYKVINSRLKLEQASLSYLYTSSDDMPKSNSILYSYLNRGEGDIEKILKAAISDTVRISTKGLTQLSIMASTAPFIGLFGTVVGILSAFSKLGNVKSASLAIVAPAISEALIATAVGIFVAVFAYAFNLFLKRKVYELSSTLESASDIIISRKK